MPLLDLHPELLCLVFLHASNRWKRPRVGMSEWKGATYVCRLSQTCRTVRAVYEQERRVLHDHIESVPFVSKTRRSKARERISRLRPSARAWPFGVVPPPASQVTSLFMRLEWERLGHVAPEWKLVLPPCSDTGWVELVCPHCRECPTSHGFGLGRRCCHTAIVSPFACPGYRIARSADSSVEATRELGEQWDHFRQRQREAMIRDFNYRNGTSDVPPEWPEPTSRPW